MKKEFTKEEKAAYYKGLRDRWAKAKELAGQDEAKAIINEHGMNISLRGYMIIAMQMREQGFDGLPYLDAKTFLGWKESGFMVRKGEHSTLEGITWIGVHGKEADPETETEEKSGFVMPKCYHLFHRTQVEARA